MFNDDIVCVHKIDGECYVNQNEVSEDTPTNLSHGEWPMVSFNSLICILDFIGDTLCIGSKTYFRFNNPQEAKKLRDTSMVRGEEFYLLTAFNIKYFYVL